MPQIQETFISQSAENALNDLHKNGDLINTVSALNVDVLRKRFKCADVYPIVGVALVREQDRYSGRRSDLAEEIEMQLSRKLATDYTGSEKRSELVLVVRITVVSDGRSRYEKIVGLMRTADHANAKLAISYCLFNRKTGEVAVAKQLSHVECTRDVDNRSEVLLRLAEGLCRKLNKEVKFICCSRINEWPEIAEGLITDSEEESL